MVRGREMLGQRQHQQIVMAQLAFYKNCTADNAADCCRCAIAWSSFCLRIKRKPQHAGRWSFQKSHKGRSRNRCLAAVNARKACSVQRDAVLR